MLTDALLASDWRMRRNSIRRRWEIKFYLALHRAGLPVCMRKANALKNRLTGKEMIGIVPTGVAPFYCHHYFPGQDIIAFMNLPTERSEPFANYCNWQKISVSNLKR